MRTKTSGKLVDTWVYAYKGPLKGSGVQKTDDDESSDALPVVRDQKVSVRVMIVKKTEESDTPPHATKEVEFRVECDCPKFSIFGTDIELLRKEAWGKCDEHYAVKWENYFLVKVIGAGGHYEGQETNISFIYTDVKKGTGWDGSLLLRERRWGGDVVISAWPGEFSDNAGRAIACIPATPANKAALEEFGSRIETMRKKLADLLRPDIIVKTLQNLGTLAILPPK